MINIDVDKLYENTVTIGTAYGNIDIPISEILDFESLKEVVKNSNNIEDVKYDLEDSAYEFITSVMTIEVNGL